MEVEDEKLRKAIQSQVTAFLENVEDCDSGTDLSSSSHWKRHSSGSTALQSSNTAAAPSAGYSLSLSVQSITFPKQGIESTHGGMLAQWVIWGSCKEASQTHSNSPSYALANFSTLSDYSAQELCCNLPRPSTFLSASKHPPERNANTTKHKYKVMLHAAVPYSRLWIAREGAPSSWGDLHQNGNHFNFTLKPNKVEEEKADAFWNGLVAGILEQTMDGSELVAGIILEDKTTGPKVARSVMIKVLFVDGVRLNLLENAVAMFFRSAVGIEWFQTRAPVKVK